MSEAAFVPYQHLLTGLYEQTPVGVAFLDLDLRFVTVNETYARITGHPAADHAGRPIEMVLGDAAARVVRGLRQVIDTRVAFDEEVPGIGTPGQPDAQWAVVYFPIVSDGQVTAVTMMMRDITQRIRRDRQRGEALTQEQLSRVEAERQRDFIHLVLQNAPMGISICEGPDYRIVLVNEFSRRLLNMPMGEVVNRPLRDVLPEAFDLVRDTFDRVFHQGETITVPELLVPLPDGRLIWSYACYAPVRHPDGSPAGVVSLGLDISEQKRTQLLLAAQKDVLEAIARDEPLTAVLERITHAIAGIFADGVLPSILLLDADGIHLRHGAAPALPDAYNQAIDGVAIGPEVGSCGSAAFLRERVVVADVMVDQRWSDFRELAAAHGLRACWSTPIIGSADQVLGTFALYYHEPRAPHPEQLRAVDLLTRTTALAIEWRMRERERHRLLEAERDARRRAEEASQSKDEFVATLSHELRTPLNAILGWTRMLRAGQVGEQSIERALEAIERNTRAQSQLVEDLLDVSRIVTGKLRLDVRSVELTTVIEAALDTVGPAAEAKNIRLQKVIDPRTAPISGDPDRLQQIVWNLLSNAIKFTPKGGRVQLRLERVNSHVEIVVADSGAGIPADLLPYIFDRFRQGDRIAGAKAGLGLGLAITRHLVELHGGTIDAASDGPDTGATFRIKLPLRLASLDRAAGDVHPTAPSPLLPAGFARLPSLRILVVEDDPDGREVVTHILSSAGADVRAVDSPAEADRLLQTWKPAVIVSDIEMPGEDGYAFIARLRQQPGCGPREVPAIALTAYARVEDRIRALAAGFQMHVPKPVEPAELIAVVSALAADTHS